MIQIRTMTDRDIELGMRLKRQAGWNQLEQDWRRCLALEPEGCFVLEREGLGLGTTTTCVMGDVAWIAMVLVDEACRGQGFGKAMMLHALDYLDGRGIASIRLDATPLGRPLYEKLGFVAQFDLRRWHGICEPSPDRAASASYLQLSSFPGGGDQSFRSVLTLDTAATRTPRDKLIMALLNEWPQAARVAFRDDQLLGYLAARRGENATQIGPCIASDSTAGEALLLDASARFAGKTVYVDIPVDHVAASAVAQNAGLTTQRLLTRMTRGTPVLEDVNQLWASTGPEKG